MTTIFSYEWAEKQEKKLRENGDDPFPRYIGLASFLLLIALIFDFSAVSGTFFAFIALAPAWFPLLVGEIVFVSFVDYKRYINWFGISRTLLEIQLPPNVEKSPEAIEIILDSLWNAGGETTMYDRVFFGKFRPVWSLEIASNEGRISFYISMPSAWKNIVSARIYGQFPEAQVEEVEDYVQKIPFSLQEYDLFGMEYMKGNPQALPIKTYKEYGLDKNTDSPEIQVDPITHILELFSSIGKDEYLWLQIIMKARKKDEWHAIYLGDKYREDAAKETKEILKKTIKRVKEVEKELNLDQPLLPITGEGEKRRAEHIDNSLTKLTFECGVRSMYLAKKEKFNGVNISALVNIFVPFKGNTDEFNGLNPAGTRGLLRYQYPWQDFKEKKHTKDKKDLWFWYKNRAYFYVPLNQEPTYLNTEELATVWHFPNASIVTPGLQRVPSRTAEAPTNLPI